MIARETALTCRVCGSKEVRFVADYQPYLDYGTAIHDCLRCGCRFAAHDASAHERLHANHSSYDAQARLSERAAGYVARSEIGRLRRFLAKTEKYRFIIRFVDEHPSLAKIAEIGCSRGLLASYLIATGRTYHGFDISATAVREATRLFGDHFHVMDDEVLLRPGEFDAVFHVGTIGCVARPIELTERLLSVLRPGGSLLFNAPVREHLEQTRSLWLPTPPPDLITIFPLRFWPDTFGAMAEVTVSQSYCSRYEALRYKRSAQRPVVASRHMVGDGATEPRAWGYHHVRRLLADGLRRSLSHFASSVVSPYGAFVVLKKKA